MTNVLMSATIIPDDTFSAMCQHDSKFISRAVMALRHSTENCKTQSLVTGQEIIFYLLCDCAHRTAEAGAAGALAYAPGTG